MLITSGDDEECPICLNKITNELKVGCSVLKNRNVCLKSAFFMGNYLTGSDMIIKEKDGEKKMRFFNFYDFLVDFSHF